MVLFVFQLIPVCNFGQFGKFGLGIVRSERVKAHLAATISPFKIPPEPPESEICETGTNRIDHNHRGESSALFEQ